MFEKKKDPALERLEQELLAVEPQSRKGIVQWDEEDLVPQFVRDEASPAPTDAVEEMKQWLAQEDWKARSREPLTRSYPAEPEEDWEQTLYDTEPEREFGSRKGKTSGGIRPGLIVALILETLGLVAVVLWWIL